MLLIFNICEDSVLVNIIIFHHTNKEPETRRVIVLVKTNMFKRPAHALVAEYYLINKSSIALINIDLPIEYDSGSWPNCWQSLIFSASYSNALFRLLIK